VGDDCKKIRLSLVGRLGFPERSFEGVARGADFSPRGPGEAYRHDKCGDRNAPHRDAILKIAVRVSYHSQPLFLGGSGIELVEYMGANCGCAAGEVAFLGIRRGCVRTGGGLEPLILQAVEIYQALLLDRIVRHVRSKLLDEFLAPVPVLMHRSAVVWIGRDQEIAQRILRHQEFGLCGLSKQRDAIGVLDPGGIVHLAVESPEQSNHRDRHKNCGDCYRRSETLSKLICRHAGIGARAGRNTPKGTPNSPRSDTRQDRRLQNGREKFSDKIYNSRPEPGGRVGSALFNKTCVRSVLYLRVFFGWRNRG